MPGFIFSMCVCGGFTLMDSWTPPQPCSHSPFPKGVRGKKVRWERERLLGWDKDNLIKMKRRKRKQGRAYKEAKWKCLFSISHQRAMFDCVLGRRTSTGSVVLREVRGFHNRSPPSPSPFPSFYCWVTPYGGGWPCAQFRSAVVGVSPPHLLPTAACWLCGAGGSLEAVPALLSHRPNTGVLQCRAQRGDS